MRVKNPNAPLPSNAADRTALDAWLKANPGRAALTFDELRAEVPRLAARKDGELHQIAVDLGLKVE